MGPPWTPEGDEDPRRVTGTPWHVPHPDISVSLLSVIVTFCGIVLLGVSLFVSWKLCWVPWRDKGGAGAAPRKEPPHPTPFGEPERGEAGAEAPERSYLDMGSCPEAALKLSQTSPELPLERDGAGGALPSATSQQQVAQSTSIGQIQPELYQPGEGDARRGGSGGSGGGTPCGRLSVALRYAYGTEQLVVRVLRARDLPAKDANGFSDPYVKMYLLPDRKKKFQTKVHRRTLNPVFDETFSFGVPFAELPARRLHFSVYDFDRFSRHDLIGQVVLDNLLEAAERDGETPIWRDILEATAVRRPLGGGTGTLVGSGAGACLQLEMHLHLCSHIRLQMHLQKLFAALFAGAFAPLLSHTPVDAFAGCVCSLICRCICTSVLTFGCRCICRICLQPYLQVHLHLCSHIRL
uniref:C2 domain-containing protein n=1 Tax=Anas zonorhyncha TaxID=75864 RepID=A0A8B9UBD9_9AVES